MKKVCFDLGKKIRLADTFWNESSQDHTHWSNLGSQSLYCGRKITLAQPYQVRDALINCNSNKVNVTLNLHSHVSV